MARFVQRLLNEQRKRAVGTIMTHLEERVYPKLTTAERQALRDKVIAAISQYHDGALDIVKASVEDGMMINEEAAAIIASELRRQIGR